MASSGGLSVLRFYEAGVKPRAAEKGKVQIVGNLLFTLSPRQSFPLDPQLWTGFPGRVRCTAKKTFEKYLSESWQRKNCNELN